VVPIQVVVVVVEMAGLKVAARALLLLDIKV
jgi:hypothetical protein